MKERISIARMRFVDSSSGGGSTMISKPIYQRPQFLTILPVSDSKHPGIPLEKRVRVLFPIHVFSEDTIGKDLNLWRGFHYLTEDSHICSASHAPTVEDGPDNLDTVLLALVSHSRSINRRLAEPQVITWRGIMTQLLTAAYLKDKISLKILFFNVTLTKDVFMLPFSRDVCT